MTRYDSRNDVEPSWGPGYGVSVAEAPAETRASFIGKTYLHVAGAVFALVGLEALLFAIVPQSTQVRILSVLGNTPMLWFLVLGAFMFVSVIADRTARSPAGPPMHYMGLALYVVAEALILFPMLALANLYSPEGTIASAAVVTLLMFGGLTAFVLLTRMNFSWLGGLLSVGFWAALAVIAAGLLFGFNFGLWFIVPMIALACGSILYQTSNLMHVYQPGQHVAAALALFASVALLFWYVLQLLMSLQRD